MKFCCLLKYISIHPFLSLFFLFEVHREEILRKQRIRYHQNKEKVKEYARNYYHQNKDKIKENKQKHKE